MLVTIDSSKKYTLGFFFMIRMRGKRPTMTSNFKIYNSTSKIPRESKLFEVVLSIGPGLLAMELPFVTVFPDSDGKRVFHACKTAEERLEKFKTVNRVEDYLAVDLSDKLLEAWKRPDVYIFNNTPFPIFAKIAFDHPVDHDLMGVTKLIDTKDVVSMEELKFATTESWKMLYEQLKCHCMACCPNGHALSFETLCNFMKEDDWEPEQCGDLVKVKCPACRSRYPIHDTVPLLAYVFKSIAQLDADKEASKRPKDDKIKTYFSTYEDEEDDQEIQDLRRMVQREEEDDDDDESEDEDYEPSSDDEPEEEL